MPDTQNQKLGNLGKRSFTLNNILAVVVIYNSETTKNELRQKLTGQDRLLEGQKNISEVSEFSILPDTQNQKLGNLGKRSFTLNNILAVVVIYNSETTKMK